MIHVLVNTHKILMKAKSMFKPQLNILYTLLKILQRSKIFNNYVW